MSKYSTAFFLNYRLILCRASISRPIIPQVETQLDHEVWRFYVYLFMYFKFNKELWGKVLSWPWLNSGNPDVHPTTPHSSFNLTLFSCPYPCLNLEKSMIGQPQTPRPTLLASLWHQLSDNIFENLLLSVFFIVSAMPTTRWSKNDVFTIWDPRWKKVDQVGTPLMKNTYTKFGRLSASSNRSRSIKSIWQKSTKSRRKVDEKSPNSRRKVDEILGTRF
jgi:hypothetical protein